MKNNNTTFYIVRHGETEWNYLGRLQGQSNSSLTVNGEKQAEELAETLQTIHFDHIFSSDLIRAKRTAEIIALERKMAIQTTEILRERSFGKFEGMYSRKLFSLYQNWETLTEEQRWKHKLADEESMEEANSRLLFFLRETAIAYPLKTILVVCHGTIMRSLLVKLGYGTFDTVKRFLNCGYIKLQSDGVDFFIEEVYGLKK